MMIKQTKLDESRVEEGNLQFVSCIFSKIIQRRNNNLFHAPRFKTLTFLSIEESILKRFLFLTSKLPPAIIF